MNFRAHLQREIAIDIVALARRQSRVAAADSRDLSFFRKTRVMATAELRNGSSPPEGIVGPEDHLALAFLLDCFEAVKAQSCSPWKAASKRLTLILKGMSEERLRFLQMKGLIAFHGDDVILTERGGAWARGMNLAVGAVTLTASLGVRDVPFYDARKRKLWFRKVLVKSFAQPARNQVLVLEGFQDSAWDGPIDDPLPPVPGRIPQQRLHDTITALNRNQAGGLVYIHFRGTGTGEQVQWSPGKDA